MNRKRTLTMVAFVAMLAVVSLLACKRNDTDNNVTVTTDDTDGANFASDHAIVEREDNDVQSIAETAISLGGSNLRVGQPELGPCTMVTNDTSAHLLTIDFGTTGCTGLDGRTRSGKILISYSGRYKDSGSVHSVTFDNYFVDSNQHMGTRTITNMGTNGSGQVYYNISVNDSLIKANGKGTISWTSTRTRTWTQGYSTPQRADDVYQIAGSATIIRANGNTLSVNITSPLQVAVDCRWIEAGTVTITPANGKVRTIDYGSGTCDALATLTFNGKTYNITLR